MVQQVSPDGEPGQASLRMRVCEYLRASGLPEDLADGWSAQILAEQPDANLSGLLRAAQSRLDDWLAGQLGQPAGLRADAARAWLPYWQDGDRPGPCCLSATPVPAELEMPAQVIPLRSLGGLIHTACRECIPFSRRISRRVQGWLRGL